MDRSSPEMSFTPGRAELKPIPKTRAHIYIQPPPSPLSLGVLATQHQPEERMELPEYDQDVYNTIFEGIRVQAFRQQTYAKQPLTPDFDKDTLIHRKVALRTTVNEMKDLNQTISQFFKMYMLRTVTDPQTYRNALNEALSLLSQEDQDSFTSIIHEDFIRPETRKRARGMVLQRLQDKILRAADETLGTERENWPTDRTQVVIAPQDIKDPKNIDERLSGIVHDIATPLTAIAGYLQLSEKNGEKETPEQLQKLCGMLEKQFADFNKQLTYIPGSIEGEYTKEFLSFENIRTTIQTMLSTNLPPNVAFDINIQGDKTPSVRAIWSEVQAQDLSRQIGQNIGRVYDKRDEDHPDRKTDDRFLKLTLEAKTVIDETTKKEQEFLFLTFADNATGFSQTFLEDGFQLHKSEYDSKGVLKGTGVGMAKVVKSFPFYGISYELSNIMRDGEIVGGVQTYKIPVLDHLGKVA